METLQLGSLPDDVQQRLRRRAARHGWTLEEEAQAILTQTVRDEPEVPPHALQQWVAERLQGANTDGMVDDLIGERRREAQEEADRDRA